MDAVANAHLDTALVELKRKTENYLFEVNVSMAAKGCFDMFRPFFLPLRVFLSPQGVDVMGDQGSRLIRGVSQTAARHPRLQAAWRRRATYVHIATDYIIKMAPHTFMRLPDNTGDFLPMFQVPTNTEIMSGSLS